MGMVALGEQTVPAGITALLIALMPLWVAVLGRIVFGERTSRLVLAGIVIGLVGVVILVAPTGIGALALSAGGIAAVLVSPLSWASGSLYSSHRARLPRLPLVATAFQMFCGALVLFVLSVVTGELANFSVGAVTGRSWLAFAYLVTIGSGIGYTTYVWLLRVAPLPKIATYAYVNPVVALAPGARLPPGGRSAADDRRFRGHPRCRRDHRPHGGPRPASRRTRPDRSATPSREPDGGHPAGRLGPARIGRAPGFGLQLPLGLTERGQRGAGARPSG